VRGTSRASLAEAKDQLAAVIAGGADLGRLGDELFAVTGLLDAHPALRRMLSDPTREARAKAALAEDLLASRIAPETLGLVRGLVGLRWSEPADIADAAEQLGALTIIEIAERERTLDDVEDELFRFGRIASGEPELIAALADQRMPDDQKRTLLDRLLSGRVAAASLRLITQAVINPRGRSLEANLADYGRLVADWRQRLIAVVRVATELSQRQRQQLTRALTAIYGHGIQLNVIIDPRVVGGMSIQIGDELIDGTLSSRLAELRRHWAA